MISAPVDVTRDGIRDFLYLSYQKQHAQADEMAVEDEKPRAEHTAKHMAETNDTNIENGSTRVSEEKKDAAAGHLPQSDDDYVLTWKTWAVVWILAWSYGISFWIVPSVAASQAVIATQLGDVTQEAWVCLFFVALLDTC